MCHGNVYEIGVESVKYKKQEIHAQRQSGMLSKDKLDNV